MKQTARSIITFLFAAALIGLMVLPVQAAPMQAPTNPGTTGLVSWWSLDETSGTRNDSHGANHLTDNNTVGYQTGVLNNAASFTLANAERLSRNDPFVLSQMTFAGWVNLDDKANHAFASKWATSNQEFELFYQLSVDRFVCWTSPNGSSSYSTVNANNFGSPNIGTWYFVSCSFDGSTLSISVNSGTPNTTTATAIYNGTAPFMIGARADNALYHDGGIDEMIYYSRALSTDELSWLYNSGAGRTYADINPPPTATHTNTATATFTLTPTNTFTPTSTATNTATFTHTSTPTFTATDRDTDTPTPTETLTPTETSTPTESPTPSASPTPSRTPTPTSTPANMMTALWQNSISYGDAAQVSVTSLLCLVVVIGLLAWMVITTLQRKRK